MEEVKEKKKFNPKKICILVLILALLAACIFIIFKCTGKKENNDYKDSALYTESFFIKNKKGKIALYNEKGKKLTDFIYESAGTFYNGVAFVMDKNLKYAVIDEKGKEVIKSDKYDTLSDYNGFFKAKKGDMYFLLSSEGKELIKGKSITVNTYNKFKPFALVNSNKQFFVYSSDGKELMSFKEKADTPKPTVSHLNEYASVFYNGETTILNLKNNKVITTIKGKDQYCINNVTDNKEVITLNSCTSWFSSSSKADNHGVITNGKFIDLSKKCTNFNVYGDTVVCSSSDAAYVLNFKGSKVEYSKNIRSNAAFYDYDNYVIRNQKSNKVDFYKNGKLKASVKGTLSVLGKMEQNIFVISDEKGYSFYNINGKKIIDESFKSVRSFDKNDNAIISDGKSYYLINRKGKTISEKYTTITNSDKYYIVTNTSGSKGVINSKGKLVVDINYKTITIKQRYNTYYAVTTDAKGLKDVYNLDSKDKIISSAPDVSLTDNIIKLIDNKNSIYNYKGKLIYSEK